MKKSIVKIVALLMVTVSVLALPLAVGASTTYSGNYGTIHYTAYTGDSQSKVKAEIEVSSSSKLGFEMYPTIYIYQNNAWVTMDGDAIVKNASLTTSLSRYYYYSYYASDFGYPNTGRFVDCDYNFKVNGHYVVSGAHEDF